MSQKVLLVLPDKLYEAVRQTAESEGYTPAEWIVSHLPELLPADSDKASLRQPVSGEIYEVLQGIAPHMGMGMAELAAEWKERLGARPHMPLTPEEYEAERQRLRRHAGAVSLGRPTGIDNEAIDADLAREYSSTHENGA